MLFPFNGSELAYRSSKWAAQRFKRRRRTLAKRSHDQQSSRQDMWLCQGALEGMFYHFFSSHTWYSVLPEYVHCIPDMLNLRCYLRYADFEHRGKVKDASIFTLCSIRPLRTSPGPRSRSQL